MNPMWTCMDYNYTPTTHTCGGGGSQEQTGTRQLRIRWFSKKQLVSFIRRPTRMEHGIFLADNVTTVLQEKSGHSLSEWRCVRTSDKLF